MELLRDAVQSVQKKLNRMVASAIMKPLPVGLKLSESIDEAVAPGEIRDLPKRCLNMLRGLDAALYDVDADPSSTKQGTALKALRAASKAAMAALNAFARVISSEEASGTVLTLTKKLHPGDLRETIAALGEAKATPVKVPPALAKIADFKKEDSPIGSTPWLIGTTKDGKYKIHAQVFSDPSSYGIEGSRISKLMAQTEKGEYVLDYQRGWGTKPTTAAVRRIVAAFLAAYPERVEDTDKDPDNAYNESVEDTLDEAVAAKKATLTKTSKGWTLNVKTKAGGVQTIVVGKSTLEYDEAEKVAKTTLATMAKDGEIVAGVTISEAKSEEDDDAPYGYCPKCGAKGVKRERRPNGNDVCEKGCEYPSKDALKKPKASKDDEDDDAEESVTVPRADLEKLLTECGKLHVPETAELSIKNGMVTVTVSKDHAGKLRTALGL
jgi:hypothetical protein